MPNSDPEHVPNNDPKNIYTPPKQRNKNPNTSSTRSRKFRKYAGKTRRRHFPRPFSRGLNIEKNNDYKLSDFKIGSMWSITNKNSKNIDSSESFDAKVKSVDIEEKEVTFEDNGEIFSLEIPYALKKGRYLFKKIETIDQRPMLKNE